MLSFAFVLIFSVLLTLSTASWAKDEFRQIDWTWRLYGGSSGDFDSAEAVIDAFNARSEQLYAACASQTCSGTCTKVIHTPPTNPVAGVSAKVNGQWTWLMTSGSTITSYHTACGANPPSGPTSTASSGSIAAAAVLRCPTEWGARSENLRYEQLNGGQATVYETSCVRTIPDPPSCPKVEPADTHCGNPIDAVGSAKLQTEVDYASANNMLRIERSYSSQSGRWSWNHNVVLVDFTGRTSVQSASASLSANLKLIPAGIYTGSAPASVEVARSFPLVRNPANSTPPQVWLTGASGRRAIFTESAGVFTTVATDKPQLSLVNSGGTHHWRVRLPQGRFESFDADGNLTQQIFADGKSLSYARQGSTLTVAGFPGGHALVYSRSNPNLVAGTYDVVTLPGGTQLQYSLNAAGLVTGVTYADTRSKTYLYNEPAYSGITDANTPSANRLTGLLDENTVRHATYTYDGYGPIATELAGGVNRYSLNTAYPGTSGARQITMPPQNAQATLHWDTGPDGERRVTVRWQPGGAGSTASTSSLTYDTSGYLASHTHYRGNKTCYANDISRGAEIARIEGLASGSSCPANIVSYTVPANTVQRKISTQWHPNWNFPIARAEPKKITTWVYNGQTDPLTSATASCATGAPTLPDGSAIAVVCKKVEQATTDETGSAAFTATTSGTPRIWSYTYNAFGQVLTADGPRTDVSDVTSYTYYNCNTGYQCGQVATITNAAGHTTTYNSYNAHGQPLSITDANDLVTTLSYDLRQRLTSRTVGSEQTRWDYWPTGLLKKAMLPDGSYLEFTYDAAHRLTAVNDGEGNRIAYTLDLAGNRTHEGSYDPFNVLAMTRTRAFDALSRVSQEIGAAGTATVTTNFGYDNNGNPATINAPLARNTTQTYDELNRLKQVTDPASGLTKYAYNGLDQLISVTDPRNKVTSYTYNGLDDLTQQVSPDTGTTINTYDSAGNLQTSTDARSKTATYGYDALGRVTSLSYPDQTISYAYDSGTNQKGRLTQVSDASGSTSWSYDAQGRVLSRQQSMGITKTLSYAYDAAGRLQTLTLPSGNAVTYGYANGKVTSLTLNGSTTILSNVLYQPFGPTQGWTWGNSTLAVREYDTDGKITDIDSAGLKTYGYDDAFRVTGIVDSTDPSLSQSYSYDVLDRITSATGTSVNQSWTYDANGNRLTQGGTQPATYTVSATSNRISAITSSLTKTYTYDAAGNTTSDGTATYTYDDAGRMVSATKDGITATYAINALGQRVRKTVAGTNTHFVYDEAGHLSGEYDNSGNLIQETVWFGDAPVATLKPNGSGGVNTFYIHTDHLDTPKRITRLSDNAIVWRWDSDPFGTTAANEDPDADTNLFVYNLRFPGQYYDAETGLHQNYFRDYDPATGRYPQSDPIGLRGGLNTYAYVKNNPLRYSDRYGLDPWLGADAGFAFAVGIGGYGGGVGGLVNPKTGESCAVSIKCVKVGPSLLFSFLGIKAKGQVNGPRCGKDLTGMNYELAADIVSPLGGVGGTLDWGSLGVGASVGPEFGAGFFVGFDICHVEVLGCRNTPCECQK